MPPLSHTRENGFPLARDLDPSLIRIDEFKPLGREVRKHPPAQIRKLAASIAQFGVVLPVLVDQHRRVVAGWAMVLAARRLELPELPAVTITDLSDAELLALKLALNRITEAASWDDQELALEFSDIMELEPDFAIEATGFEIGEIDRLQLSTGLEEEDEVAAVDPAVEAVTRPGDLWILGDHRVLCADAREPASYEQLLQGEKAQIVFTDPPYNVKIAGNVSGLGAVKHSDFAIASGEMSGAAFQDFLSRVFGLLSAYSEDGSVHFVCMDWRHQKEIILAGEEKYSEALNLCVWRKTNAGMGSLYRSHHELVFVFKSGTGPHINNVALGKHGRNRTNVWDYVGQNSLNGTQRSKLSLHPTVKPVAMVADALRDCSKPKGIVLDPFGGAGTTLIAAERTGRSARLTELEPRYVDCTIERWQRLTGGRAIHATTGAAFGARSTH